MNWDGGLDRRRWHQSDRANGSRSGNHGLGGSGVEGRTLNARRNGRKIFAIFECMWYEKIRTTWLARFTGVPDRLDRQTH